MPPRPMVGRLILMALRNVEAKARLEERQGKRTDLAMHWLKWLLTDKGLGRTAPVWPSLEQVERDEAIIQLRDTQGMMFQQIADAVGMQKSATIKAYYALKERLKTL